ncbi:unnamed protein product [Caenorhabditis auriculariae]|uniref:Uncharacterized protein n=1 Tax=Caenorhabditis auriculariae TaxID=2777116 RepID=A0A8S1H1U9_9PELO|nr:unnamed protein product [Caenorhabditis auriculariae]
MNGQLLLAILLCLCLSTSALRGALFRSGRSVRQPIGQESGEQVYPMRRFNGKSGYDVPPIYLPLYDRYPF